MRKTIYYGNSEITSYEIDGVPCVNMKELLECLVPNAWSDYIQVLNSADDMIFDLGIMSINNTWVIPVHSCSNWLFSFSLRNMTGNLYENFRAARRTFEKVARVAWALDVEGIRWLGYDNEFKEPASTIPITNIFSNYGISDMCMEGFSEDHRQMKGLEYIGYIASSTECGPRGTLLSNQIDYIENLPNAEVILDYLDEILSDIIDVSYIRIEAVSLDEFLDNVNSIISSETTRFFGEVNAA